MCDSCENAAAKCALCCHRDGRHGDETRDLRHASGGCADDVGDGGVIGKWACGGRRWHGDGSGGGGTSPGTGDLPQTSSRPAGRRLDGGQEARSSARCRLRLGRRSLRQETHGRPSGHRRKIRTQCWHHQQIIISIIITDSGRLSNYESAH